MPASGEKVCVSIGSLCVCMREREGVCEYFRFSLKRRRLHSSLDGRREENVEARGKESKREIKAETSLQTLLNRSAPER